MNVKKLAAYLAVAFGLSWTLGFLFFANGGRVGTGPFVAMGVVYMFTPAIAAVVAQKFVAGQPLKELGLRVPRLSWLIVSWLTPVVLVGLTILISTALPGVSLDLGLAAVYEKLAATLSPAQLAEAHRKLDHGLLAMPGALFAISFLQALIAGPSINAAAAFGEELGWRGLMGTELRSLGFWRPAFVTGVVWGIWHLPFIVNGYNYPGYPVLGPLMMTGLTVLLAPLLLFVRIRARSVFAPAVFHGTFNALAGFGLFLHGGSVLTVGATGAAGFIVLAAANGALWVYLRRNPNAAEWPAGID